MSRVSGLGLAVLALASVGLRAHAADSLPRLHTQGTRLVDPAGKPVTLKGVNLGNWLVIETWMLQWGDIPDQYTIVQILTDRFGKAEADRLMGVYRDNYVTQRDLDAVKGFGFNLVRVPFAWDLFEESGDAAFKYLDGACDMAEKAGVYVILDLHGAPGGQSKEHHTYREKQNKFFSDEQNLQRSEEIWRRVARHFKGRSNVVAYDLVNEPYGDYQEDLREPLVKLGDRLYKAIRAEDPDTLILLPGTLQGSIEHYGDPHAKGMTNVGFTEHFYLGLFGSPSRPQSHYGLINGKLKGRKEMLDKLGAPYLVGEFNVVLDKAGGDPMMRRYYDLYEQNGWLATAWSWKLLKAEGGAAGDNWYFATNAKPLAKLDIRSAIKEEIEGWFKGLGTMPLAYDESLRKALTAKTPPPIPETPGPKLPEKVPGDVPPSGWKVVAVGEAKPRGGYQGGPKTALVSGGSDVWAEKDSVVMLARPMAGDGELTVTIDSLLESGQYAKGGIMLRASDAPGAATVFLHAFPDGGTAVAARPTGGGIIAENKQPAGNPHFPIRLRLVRQGATVTASIARGKGEWKGVGMAQLPTGEVLAGVAATSNDGEALTAMGYRELKLSGQ